jgi:hypothetical protein
MWKPVDIGSVNIDALFGGFSCLCFGPVQDKGTYSTRRTSQKVAGWWTGALVNQSNDPLLGQLAIIILAEDLVKMVSQGRLAFLEILLRSGQGHDSRLWSFPPRMIGPRIGATAKVRFDSSLLRFALMV